MASTDICALCNMPDTNHITGKLQKMPGRNIVAHYNCMMYSPEVTSIDSQEDMQGFDFNIRSVLNEIKRGKKLRCSSCKRLGATVGCDVASCRKNYHFPCLIKANGFPSQDKYIVHCELHKGTDNDTEDSDGKTKKDISTSRKKKGLQSTTGETRKNTIKNQHNNDVMHSGQINDQSERSFLLPVHPVETEEDNEEALPSLSALLNCSPGSCERTGGSKSVSKIKHLTCRKCETPLPDGYESSWCPSCRPHTNPEQPIQDVIVLVKDYGQSSLKELNNTVSKKRPRNQFPQSTSSDTSSEESDSILAPKVIKTFSLSGFPKRKKERSSKRKPNEEQTQKLEEVLQGMSSQEKNDLSQIYSELGGSQQDPAIEIVSPQENQNDTVMIEDSMTIDVTDTSTSSNNDEIDKTPGRLPNINVHVNPPRSSTEEENFTEKHPVSSRDEEIPVKMSVGISKTELKFESVISKIRSILPPKSSNNNIKDSLQSIHDASACIDIPEAQSPEFSNGAVRPEVSPMATIGNGNRRVAHLGASNDIRLTAQQIHSTNCEDTLPSQPKSCTDASKSVRPDTSVGYSLDLFSEQQANNLEAQGTSVTHPSGCPAVSQPESSVGPTLEKDGNKTEVSPNVSNDNMKNGLSASQHLNRESLRLASPSNVTIWQDTEKGQNKGNISTVVSPKQIKAISREIMTGNLAKQLKSIVPQIQSALGSQKRNATKGAEHRRDGQAISEGSPNSSTNNRPEATSAANDLPKPLGNQERSGNDQVCQERSESITLKRKLSQDFEKLLPHKKLQQTEENVLEQLEISVEQNENNFRENSTSGSESERESKQQSGPSRMTTPFRQRTEGNVSEQLEISEEQNENNFRENATSGSVESERASEHQSGPSRMTTPFRRRLVGSRHMSKNRSGGQHGRFGELDDIDGFGRAVAGQCRYLPHDRQAKYMSYVFASADLFCACPTLPELSVLITSLQTALETSQTSIHSSCGSVV